MQVGAIYEDYTGPDNAFFSVFLSVPALEFLLFKAYYARTAISGADDIFKLDERSMILVQATVQMTSFMSLTGRYTRRWERGEAVNDWNIGVGFGATF